MNQVLKNLKQYSNQSFKPMEFVVVFLVIFFVACIFLFAIDFVPEPPGKTTTNTHVAEAATVTFSASAPITETVVPKAQSNTVASIHVVESDMPVRVSIPKVGIDTRVTNPQSTAVSALDTALLSGAVRYPSSATLSESAPMLIFGHQSYLPVIHNQAFKAFNSLQNVRPGDDVIVSSTTVNYHYRVTSIDYVDVEGSNVSIGGNAHTLILITCDSFGKQKTKRYVVQAEFNYEEPITTHS